MKTKANNRKEFLFKNVFKIAALSAICFFSLVNVSASNENCNAHPPDLFLLTATYYFSLDTEDTFKEELRVYYEPEIEVEFWMLRPFRLGKENCVTRNCIFSDYKKVMNNCEPEIEVESWMLKPFLSDKREYANENSNSISEIELSADKGIEFGLSPVFLVNTD